MLAARQLEMYNKPASARKADGFFECFAETCGVFDLLTGGQKLDAASFRPRYRTVFRKSPSLLAEVTKRVFIERKGGAEGGGAEGGAGAGGAPATTFALDYEAYSGLRAPMGALDGSEGLSAPRQAHIIVLYECRDNLIQRMWLTSDEELLGPDAEAEEEEVLESDSAKAALAIAAAALGEPTAVHYNQYHEIETCG